MFQEPRYLWAFKKARRFDVQGNKMAQTLWGYLFTWQNLIAAPVNLFKLAYKPSESELLINAQVFKKKSYKSQTKKHCVEW